MDITHARRTQGQIVRAHMDRNTLTYEALAQQIGVTPAYLHRMVKGDARLTKPEKIAKLSDILGIRTDQLWLSGGMLPPDVAAAIERHPEMLSAMRKLSAMLDQKKGATT